MSLDRHDCLFIDPGVNATGWAAASRQGTLESCGLARPKKDSTLALPGAVHEIWVEMPVIYPRGRQKARPKDVLRIAEMAGQLVSTAKYVGGGTAVVRYLEPSQWKGQVPKAIMNDRVISILHPGELDIVARCLSTIPPSLQNNTIDAVGIWLFVNGRL